MDPQPEQSDVPLPPPRRRGIRLRREIPLWVSLLCAALSVVLFFGIWSFLTMGEGEARRISPTTLPSPKETFAEFYTLWFDRLFARNLLVTLRRVSLGFALAVVVGVPLGVLAGCFSAWRAFLAPSVVFGRNIPLAAVIPLTYLFFGIDEWQKVMFIFIACVAFVIADATLAISDISSRYLDTAYTLGANAWQTILKVLVPLAMPTILDSARVLFGLAFGYIMLAETIKMGADDAGGIGQLILASQRQGPRAHIYLIILLIPIVAVIIDRILFSIQKGLFPHRYGGQGILNQMWRFATHRWDDLKSIAFRPRPPFDQLVAAHSGTSSDKPTPPTSDIDRSA